MDGLSYEVLMDVGSFPEVAPPPLKGTVWILGREYHLPQDKGAMSDDVRSRLWCSYRKNFRAISGTSHTTDTGWGCTLRCGQMLLAQTLINKHLGRDWRWAPQRYDPNYKKILNKFLDKRDSEYSIQMIAQQGADFGRPVGHWFGPNNVAQAIRKLSAHDQWSQLAVHVAMDMVVVIQDLKSLCRQPHEVPYSSVDVTTETGEMISLDVDRQRSISYNIDQIDSTQPSPTLYNRQHGGSYPKGEAELKNQYTGGGFTNHEERPYVKRAQSSPDPSKRSKTANLQIPMGPIVSSDVAQSMGMSFMKVSLNEFGERSEVERSGDCDCEDGFRSLLLFVPLRLGQDKFNPEYGEALKACLTVPQSVGFIGGKPRHALYFIGYHGDHLLYLDPHTTQSSVAAQDPAFIPDSSYHCPQADRMNINDLDPSLALGFFCRNEADLDDLCQRLRQDVLSKMKYMFELTETRPTYWSPVDNSAVNSIKEPFLLVTATAHADSETEDSDGFEMIDFPTSPAPPQQ